MAKLYIAYGSNLNKEQMRYRCPTATFEGTAEIEDYELQFRGSPHGAHATIVPKEGSAVPVGIWKIQPRDEKRLDMYEGYPGYYDKQNIQVTTDNGVVEGMVYIMDQRMRHGLPTGHYYEIVEEGYRDCGLDTDILEKALEDSCQRVEEHKQSMYRGGMGMW